MLLMDWNLAIESKRAPLLQHVLGLFARIGLTEGLTIERVSRPVYREVLGILRTAESAVRRLIIAAARDIVVEYKPRRPASVKPKTSSKDKGRPKDEGKAKRKRRPLFGLFDPIRRFRRRFKKRRRAEPRIHSIESFLQQKQAEIAAAPGKAASRRRRHREREEPDPPSHRRRGCLARHPAPGSALRAVVEQAL